MIDRILGKAIGLSQATIERYLEIVDDWSELDKIQLILAIEECGCDFDEEAEPENFDLGIYQDVTLCELDEQFVEEGVFGKSRSSCDSTLTLTLSLLNWALTIRKRKSLGVNSSIGTDERAHTK